MEKDLNKILMSDGKTTAAQWLDTVPEQHKQDATEAISECLNRNWPLNDLHLTYLVREEKRNRASQKD